MRAPISSAAPPQAAAAPPLAEPRCDWLAGLPDKTFTAHAAKRRPHCVFLNDFRGEKNI